MIELVKGHRHDAHYLDKQNLSSAVKKSLDRPGNRRLYDMCLGSDADLDVVVNNMLTMLNRALETAGPKWSEISLSWGIPQGTFQRLGNRFCVWTTGWEGPKSTALRIASVPLAEDLEIISLSFVRLEA